MQKEFLSPEIKENIWKVVFEYKAKREKVLADLGLDEEKFKSDLRKIKEEIFKDIESLREQTIANLTKNGIKVFGATDTAAAQKIVKDLTQNDKIIYLF